MGLQLKTEWTVNPLTEAGDDLLIQSKYKIESYSIEVKEDGKPWSDNTDTIGWADWKLNKIIPNPDGSTKIVASLYNESHNKVRDCRIVANVS